MAGNQTDGGIADQSQSSSNAPSNGAAPKAPGAENMATSASAPGRSDPQEDRREGRDQRVRGRGRDRGRGRGRGNSHGGRQKQEMGRGEWGYNTYLLLIDYTAN